MKVARARDLLEELELLIKDYRSTAISIGDSTYITYKRAETGEEFQIRLYNSFKVERPPDYLSAVTGDIIHNLRASLDIMACDLARAAKNSPKNVYFPFARDENQFRDAIKAKNFHRAGQGAVELLLQYKPYAGGNEALRMIHDLDISDKHSALVPKPKYEIPLVWHSADGAGKPIVPFLTLDPKILMEFRLCFPEGTPFADKEFVPTLHELVQLVDGIVEAFEALVRLDKPR